MNNTSEPIVLDDDDDVEIIGAYDNNSSLNDGIPAQNTLPHPGLTHDSLQMKISYVKPKNALPPVLNGYTRPSYSFCELVARVLSCTAERRATSEQICDVIAKKYPYFEQLTSVVHWQGSIFGVLKNRKKYFSVVYKNVENKLVWGFNPKHEQYIMNKWGPKSSSTKKKSSSITTRPILPKILSRAQTKPASAISITPVTVSSDPPSPVIVYAGSLATCSNLFSHILDDSSANPETLEKDPLEPECSLMDPGVTMTSVQRDLQPWEPEVTLCAMPVSQEKNVSSLAEDSPKNRDFSLDNLQVGHRILKEEIVYRVNFNKEHGRVEKFRLHCTVCDEHLGTSGLACRHNVRLHSSLGVLLCLKCYNATCNITPPSCLWCGRAVFNMIKCGVCPGLFCRDCIKRNFGIKWTIDLQTRFGWQCLCCDVKQIWPHRAIAYFLFRHYRLLKRRLKEQTNTNEEQSQYQPFFAQDFSTCCNATARSKDNAIAVSSESTVASGATDLMTETSATSPTTSQLPLFVIGEQPPNCIYVQTQSSSPTVTLNTGTQYIQNIYPDKSYVVVEPTVENSPVSSRNSSTLTNIDSPLLTQPSAAASCFPVRIPPQHREANVATAPVERVPPPYSFHNSPPPPYSAVVEKPPALNSSNDTNKNPESETRTVTNNDFLASKTVQNKNVNLIVTEASEICTIENEEPIIIPDEKSPEELRKQEEKVIAKPILSARERIERRPMPKSKKQSLLRTVLMNESIESMKKHLQLQSENNVLDDKNETSVQRVSPISRTEEKAIEEPILQSIIKTATDRLLSLQRSSSMTSNTGNNSDDVSLVGTVTSTCIDLCEDDNSSSRREFETIPPVCMPKIKIKNLKELQDPKVHDDSHNRNKNDSMKDDDDGLNVEFHVFNQTCVNESNEAKNVDDEMLVNITGLKQGIIEASRTLINTQKKFKELAKVISSNLMYKPEQAFDLVSKFHDILKSCYSELDHLNGTVKQQFGQIIQDTDIASILPTITESQEASKGIVKPLAVRKRKKQRKSKFYPKKPKSTIPQRSFENGTGENIMDIISDQTETPDNFLPKTNENNIQSLIEKERDLLHFNPFGKKVILGSPEITDEDLRQIPDALSESSQRRLNNLTNASSHNDVYLEELRRRQYLAKKLSWKKKNIWLTTRRKKRKYSKRSLQCNPNGSLMYNENGTLIKKRHYKKRRIMDDSDDNDSTYKPTYTQQYSMRHRKTFSELSRPLRFSGRNHPSTVALVAQLTSPEHLDYTRLMTPCSVVLERVDPGIVEVLNRSVLDSNYPDKIE